MEPLIYCVHPFLLSLESKAAEAAIQAADASGFAGALPPDAGYVTFDMEYLEGMAGVLRGSIGTIVTVGIWIFLVVLGVFTAISIIKNLAR